MTRRGKKSYSGKEEVLGVGSGQPGSSGPLEARAGERFREGVAVGRQQVVTFYLRLFQWHVPSEGKVPGKAGDCPS